MRIRWKGKQGSGGPSSPARASLPEAGYTFVEVLVAFAILGFVTVSLYGAFAAGFCVIQSTRENLRATQIMMQKMEAVRLFTWSQVGDTNKYLLPSFTEYYYDPLGTATGNKGTLYTGNVRASVPTATDLPGVTDYRTNMRTITVTVNWTTYNGAKPMVHTREMQTRVARNGMQNYIWGDL